MSLPVPLSVRVGDRHITKQIQSFSFRKEAVGGVRSITFSLSRPLTDLNGLDPLAKVYVYDTRSASVVAQGRFSDPGRSADSSGQRWDCVAFGPAQHASDITAPLTYVDRVLGDNWRQVEVVHQEATFNGGAAPGDLSTAPAQGLLAQFPNDLALTGAGVSRLIELNTVVATSAQKLARVRATWRTGVTDSSYEVLLITGPSGASTTIAASAAASTTGGQLVGVVGTNFANGHDSVRLHFHRAFGNATVVGDTTWAFFSNIVVRAMQYAANGTEITTGYTADAITVPEVVNDLLGRRLKQYDGANATVGVTSTAIEQLAYPNGVTAEQVLSDLMQLEPAYRWYTTPDTTGAGYGFSWSPWPTTVRYEATLDDGGSFPLSTQSLYNNVCVTYRDESGRPWASYRTKACPILDNQGISRMETFDLGSDLGSASAAAAAGDSFLAQNNVPKNSGSLTVARPIRDVIRGCDVMPWEIEAGELVRIRGVEAYPDAFNTSTNDGVGVFRIYALEYNSDGNTASLSLDSDPHTTEDALVQLIKEQNRR